jgi:hypothetical protein
MALSMPRNATEMLAAEISQSSLMVYKELEFFQEYLPILHDTLHNT